MAQNGEKAVLPLIINNESVVGDIKFDVTNPATGELSGRCASASVDDANRAVAAAQAAFPAWSKTSSVERRDILMKAADIMLSRKEEFIGYQMEETGAGRMFVEHTFMMGVNLIKDFAGRISSIEGSVPFGARQNSMVYKEPYGVVLGIAPWYDFTLHHPNSSQADKPPSQERSIYPRNTCSCGPLSRR